MNIEDEYDSTTPQQAQALVREAVGRIGQAIYEAIDEVRTGKGDPLATLETAAQALLFIEDDIWTPSFLSVENLKI